MASINTIETESIQVGTAGAPPTAAVDIWPSLDPTAPFTAQSWGVSNFIGAHNQIGVHNGIGLLNQLGLDSVIGFHTKVGGEANAEPGIESSAPYMTFNSPFGLLSGSWKYNGSNICAPCPSDERAKTNVKPLENSLEKVLNLQGVSFNWNSDVVPDKASTQETSIGLIAQEVEKVVPEVVVNQIIENEDLKTVEYGNLTALLIEAVKEQQEQINILKQTVEELSTKLAECCS